METAEQQQVGYCSIVTVRISLYENSIMVCHICA